LIDPTSRTGVIASLRNAGEATHRNWWNAVAPADCFVAWLRQPPRNDAG